MIAWNLLEEVRDMIPSEAVQYRKVGGSVVRNSFGYLGNAGVETITVTGCYIQPLPKQMYAQLGLQMNENARRVFLPADAKGIESYPVQGDVLLFHDKEWRIYAADNWFEYDGWKSVDVVEIKDRQPLPISSGGVVAP